MALQLTDEWYAIVPGENDEDAKFVLRQPSNKELNDFLSSRMTYRKQGKMEDKSTQKRYDFFDLLLIGVENLVDKEGLEVTPEKKELIPANWKHDIILKKFENTGIDVKN